VSRRKKLRVTHTPDGYGLRLHAPTGHAFIEYQHARQLADLIHDAMDTHEQQETTK